MKGWAMSRVKKQSESPTKQDGESPTRDASISLGEAILGLDRVVSDLEKALTRAEERTA